MGIVLSPTVEAVMLTLSVLSHSCYHTSWLSVCPLFWEHRQKGRGQTVTYSECFSCSLILPYTSNQRCVYVEGEVYVEGSVYGGGSVCMVLCDATSLPPFWCMWLTAQEGGPGRRDINIEGGHGGGEQFPSHGPSGCQALQTCP